MSGSFIYCFLPFIDLNEILNSVNPKLYEFPLTTEDIDAIVSLPKPRSIDRTNIESNRAFFDQFITQINEWLGWFERFADISQHIIEWLKNYNVSRSNEVLIKLLATRDDPRITLLEMRMTIESVLKLLSPFKDLRRLCDFFNCSNPFQVLDPGALSIDQNTSKYLTDVKQFHSNNTRTVQGRERVEQNITIGDRQQVQWSVVSENHPCHIIVEYRNNASNNKHEVIFEKENVPIHKHVLNGLFETQRGGQLLITIDNRQASSVKTIWYRIKSTALATCHLFHGIFNLIFDQYYPLKSQTIRESELSQILDRVFSFINTLLDGSISLQNMKELQGIFRDRNINIQEEVKKLYANRSTEQNNDAGGPACNAIGNVDEGAIKRICEWLQIYQYYSHINVILECIQKFDLLPLDTEDETIGNLRRFNGKENCSLKDIVQDYQILQQRFQSLSHQHLQLIKTARDCSNVVQMMKASNLYSDQGRRRFQELRDNLTTQFQMQERNNMILNSWIMTYTLIEPFTSKAKNFDDFVLRLSKLSNLEENSLNDIKSKC